MRDAFGGTFMVQILLVFIVIYVGFIAIAINYGRAFRVKNYVIDYLEENQINSLDGLSVSKEDAFVKGIVSLSTKNGYIDSNNNICSQITSNESVDGNPLRCINGIVIELNKSISKNGVTYVYYTVNTYIGYNLGFLNSLLSLGNSRNRTSIAGYFKISGETKVIVTN